MDLTNKYILKSWANRFILVTGFLIILFTCQSIYNFLLDLLRAGESLQAIVQYFSLEILILIPFLIPISFFISILITFLSLQKTGQITAFKSFGLSLFKLSTPLFIVGILISFLVLLLSTTLIPVLVERNSLFIERINASNTSSFINEESHTLTYENFSARRLWFIEDFNYSLNEGGYSILHQMDISGNEINRIIANSSSYDSDLKTWFFAEGTELLFDPTSGDPLRSIPFENKQFLNLEESPKDFQLFNKALDELSLFQLERLLNLVPKNIQMYNSVLIEYYSLLLTPFSVMLFVGLSIPFIASAQVRGSLLRGVFQSVLIVLSFFIIVMLFKNFGRNFNLPALLIVLTPYLLYLAYSIKLFWRQ